jgi:hypothetical protein
MNQNNINTPFVAPPNPSRTASYFTDGSGALVRRDPMVWWNQVQAPRPRRCVTQTPPVMRDCVQCGEPAWVSPETPWQNALCENHEESVNMDDEQLLPPMPRRCATVAAAEPPMAMRQAGSNFTAPPDAWDGWTWEHFPPRSLLAEYEKQLPSKGVTPQAILEWFTNPDPVTHPAWAAYAQRFENELNELKSSQDTPNTQS